MEKNYYCRIRESALCTTRAGPLSFRAIKDLTISHCAVGRKISRGRTFRQLAFRKDDYQSRLLVVRYSILYERVQQADPNGYEHEQPLCDCELSNLGVQGSGFGGLGLGVKD